MDGGICRIKLPGGLITADQALAVAQAAERFAGGVIEATNRGNLQIRGIGADHDGLIASLLGAGLGPGNPASDDVRNLMLSPTAGLDPQQLLDVRQLAGQILHTLEHHPRFHELSPKFALSLDGGEGLAMIEHPHDLWLSAMCVDGQTLLGFGLAGCPANDSPLAAVAPEAAHALVVAVLETFLDLARPEHARMRDLLKEVPVVRFMEHVAARFAQPLRVNQDITGWRREPIRPLAHLGTYAQAQHGVVAIGAAVPLGRMGPSMLREAARLACAYGDGQLCMTPWQSLTLRNVAVEHSMAVMDALEKAGLLADADVSLARMIACTGSAACAKGLADTKADALRLSALLQKNAIRQTVHLSGCRRSCAAAHIAAVTLLAASPGRYDLYFRHADAAGFGDLHARDLTIDAVGALLTADSRSNTDD
jgi:precorrin-3B synthase